MCVRILCIFAHTLLEGRLSPQLACMVPVWLRADKCPPLPTTPAPRHQPTNQPTNTINQLDRW